MRAIEAGPRLRVARIERQRLAVILHGAREILRCLGILAVREQRQHATEIAHAVQAVRGALVGRIDAPREFVRLPRDFG